ncbi:MAG: AAA family ATPase [Chitinivibrionales bacterium]|nr:AAA family ATPase [Chitinivibrionales bacterium]MBD3357852.1 AAA family ATPase [Chitinivibrionales bacterium]
MNAEVKGPFDHIPRSVAGSFVLYLYAAIYRLMKQINRLSEAGGSELEAQFKRYPFLSDYFLEMRQHMPEDISWEEGGMWWRESIREWEKPGREHLPLRALMSEGGLSFESCLAFMITGLVEEDSRFGTLFAELQEPLPHRRPTLELVGQMMVDDALIGQSDPWVVCRPLLTMGLVESPNRHEPRSEWLLRVPPLLWDAVRGEVDPHPASWMTFTHREAAAGIDDVLVESILRNRLSHVPSLFEAGIAHILIVRGPQGCNAHEVVKAVAREGGRHVVRVDGMSLSAGEDAQFLGAFCTMTNSLPLIAYDLAPGETVSLPSLKGYPGPVAVQLGTEGGLSALQTRRAVTLELRAPDAELREAFWRRSLKDREIDCLEDVVNRFHLAGEYIQQVADIGVAHAALEGREMLCMKDVRRAARALNRHLLDTLADYLQPHGGWSSLVTVESTANRLRELEKRCLYREQVIEHLGPAFGNTVNRGVRALFTGAAGTGKTMAARILASELGMDLYRVDLSAIINKYIGETEKNLHRILSRAEALDIVLLLDEGDSLLGQRTDVKSANDRYANLETNFLLQRLENYQGIVVITTNLVENIDRAFQRRMDVVVPFFSPQAQERLHILGLHLPKEHKVDLTYMELTALRCRLTGGQIRNAAMEAALLALDDGAHVKRRHLESALRNEYRKAGGTFPLEYVDEFRENDGGMTEFVSALSNR